VASERRARLAWVLVVVLALGVVGARLLAADASVRAAGPAVDWNAKIDLQQRLKDVEVQRTPDGEFVVLRTPAGDEHVSTAEFVERLWNAQQDVASHGWLFRVLNITTPIGLAWVLLGFGGQALFTSRMLLQWWASEKAKRSVVPESFWWASLVGGVMLLVYFVWRKDVVGVIGQSTGAFVYARNLVLIHRHHQAAA
jgi:lipid-A-disaccharide synthase-like uncharacterized protein